MTHTGVKPFECTLCQYKTTKKQNPANHHPAEVVNLFVTIIKCDNNCNSKVVYKYCRHSQENIRTFQNNQATVDHSDTQQQALIKALEGKDQHKGSTDREH